VCTMLSPGEESLLHLHWKFEGEGEGKGTWFHQKVKLGAHTHTHTHTHSIGISYTHLLLIVQFVGDVAAAGEHGNSKQADRISYEITAYGSEF